MSESHGTALILKRHEDLEKVATYVKQQVREKSLELLGEDLTVDSDYVGLQIKDAENTPVVKTTSVISVVRRTDVPRTPCIHCGLCSECCPMNLSPNTIYEMLNQGLRQKAAEEGARECIACGSCSYVCPSGIDLTNAIARFAGEGRIIEENSLLDNSASVLKPSDDLEAAYVGEASLLEEYSDGDEEANKVSSDSIVLPFEKDKRV